MALDPDIAGLLTVVNAAPPMAEMTPVEAREAFRKLTVREPTLTCEVADTEVAGRPARVYGPAGLAGDAPTVVMFHGGGFVIGDLDTHDHMARSIAVDADVRVVSVDYRLAPEHPFPAAVEDAIAAVTEIAAEGGVVAVAGDSAGGNLAAVAAQAVPEVAAQLLVYPAVDMGGDYGSRVSNGEGYFLDIPTMTYFIGNYLADEVDVADPRLSPLAGVRPGLAPAVLVMAEYDPLRDEGIAFAAALEAAGVPVTSRVYDGMIHGFFDMGMWSPAAQAAIDDAVGVFADVLRGIRE